MNASISYAVSHAIEYALSKAFNSSLASTSRYNSIAITSYSNL
jgi:hypothetical protein